MCSLVSPHPHQHLLLSVFLIIVILVKVTEKAMAPHSSTLAWRVPWTEEPGRLQSMGSRGVRHDWVTSLSLFTFMHWRRKWQSIPVLLPGKSHGCKRVVGYSPWGRKESDTTEQLHFHFNHISNEIKRCLLFGRKVMTNLDSRFKSRDITLPKDVCLVKAMVFPVVIYGCESWTVKKAEHQRFDAFELWCWKRLLSGLILWSLCSDLLCLFSQPLF